MSDPLPFKGRSVSVTAVLLQDADILQIDESLSAKIAQVPPDFFTTQPLIADLSALEGSVQFFLNIHLACNYMFRYH